MSHLALTCVVLLAPAAQSPDPPRPGTGLVFDVESYRGTPYKPVLTQETYRGLPERVSLERFCPTPGDQGRHGTCAAWAIGYHMRTVLYGIEHGLTERSKLDAHAFSPAFIYELIKDPSDVDCQAGSNPVRGLDTLETLGIASAKTMPYVCNQAPSAGALLEAVDHRIEDYTVLFFTDEMDPRVRVDATRKALAEGYPVVLCFIVAESFYQPGRVWHEQPADNGPSGQHGRHAMLVVGYDDTFEGGTFRVLNSWGPKWADGGFVWIPYREYGRYTMGALQAYGPRAEDRIDPALQPDKAWLAGKLSFELRNGEPMPAYRVSGRDGATDDLAAYRMTRPYPSGTRFRFRANVRRECFLYGYASDLTGEVNQILPFEDGMSPRIGEGSTLAFPSESKVIRMDAVPGEDYLLLLYAAAPIDAAGLLAALRAAEGSFSDRVRVVLAERLIEAKSIRYEAGRIEFLATRPRRGDVVPLLIEIRHE